MIEEKVTLIGYNSKKQPYIFLVASVLVFIMGILFLLFADAQDKYGCILCFFMGTGFLFCFVSELKQPDERIKIIDDRRIVFYTRNGKQIINIYEVRYVEYWPNKVGIKMRFYTMSGNQLVTCMLRNSKEVKQHLLNLFDKHGIKVKKRYNSRC